MCRDKGKMPEVAKLAPRVTSHLVPTSSLKVREEKFADSPQRVCIGLLEASARVTHEHDLSVSSTPPALPAEEFEPL